jgi:hypothetical protein
MYHSSGWVGVELFGTMLGSGIGCPSLDAQQYPNSSMVSGRSVGRAREQSCLALDVVRRQVS